MLNNINVKISRGGYKMKKHKYIFFLTILLFIIIYTILIPAHVSAQGSFFDALCVAIANNVNELVIGQEVDQETKQIQISAVKVFLRGDESDWDEFVDSTKNWAESSLKTESSKTTQPTTYRKEQQKFVKEVSRIKKNVGKTYYFEGKIGNIDFTMEVPPYKYDNKYVNREAKIIGIYPLNSSKTLGDKIKSFFTSENKSKKYFVIINIVDAKEKTYWPSYLSTGDCRVAFGQVFLIIDENTKYLDILEETIISAIFSGFGFNTPWIEENVKWNIPDIFVYDLDHDGFDEIIYLDETTYINEQTDYKVRVCSPKDSTKGNPLGKGFSLVIAAMGYKMVAGRDGSIENKFIEEVNYREIYFDGDNLYVDGKNIMEYK